MPHKLHSTIDSRYIAVRITPYCTQHKHFKSKTSIIRSHVELPKDTHTSPSRASHGRAMDIFRELFGEKTTMRYRERTVICTNALVLLTGINNLIYDHKNSTDLQFVHQFTHKDALGIFLRHQLQLKESRQPHQWTDVTTRKYIVFFFVRKSTDTMKRTTQWQKQESCKHALLNQNWAGIGTMRVVSLQWCLQTVNLTCCVGEFVGRDALYWRHTIASWGIDCLFQVCPN